MLSIIIGSARLALAVGGAFGRALVGIGRWLRAQHDCRTLCEMQERELRDIGLRDSDLQDAAPYVGDPTAIIAIRAEGRRRRLPGGVSVDEALREADASSPSRATRRASDSGPAPGERLQRPASREGRPLQVVRR